MAPLFEYADGEYLRGWGKGERNPPGKPVSAITAEEWFLTRP